MSEFKFDGVPQVSTALEILFHRHAADLTPDELKWFTNLADVAEDTAKQLKEVCESVGCVVASDNSTGSFQGQDDSTAFAWMVKHQLDTIQGCITVSKFAVDRLLNPDIYRKCDVLRRSK